MAFSDNLDGVGGTFLRNRTGWSRPTGSDEVTLVAGGSGYVLTNGTTAASGTWHAPTSQPSSNNQYVEAQLGGGGAANAFPLGVRCNTASATGQGYLCRRNSATTVQLFYRNSSGTLTQLGSTYTGTQANLDANKVRLEVSGTSVSVKFMGSTIIGPVTDTNIASGSVAMLSRGGTAGATYNVDDWESGDISSGTTVTVTAGTMSYSGQTATTIQARVVAVTAAAMSYAGQALTTIRAATVQVIAGTMNYATQSVSVDRGIPVVVSQAFGRLRLRLGL